MVEGLGKDLQSCEDLRAKITQGYTELSTNHRSFHIGIVSRTIDAEDQISLIIIYCAVLVLSRTRI